MLCLRFCCFPFPGGGDGRGRASGWCSQCGSHRLYLHKSVYFAYWASYEKLKCFLRTISLWISHIPTHHAVTTGWCEFDGHGCYSYSRLLFICEYQLCANLRQQGEYRWIWRDNTRTLRLCDVRSQLWWCHDVWSEKTSLMTMTKWAINDSFQEVWVFVATNSV